MTFANLIIGDRDWLLAALACMLVAAGLLWWAYRRVTVTRGVRTAALLLKLTGLALLASFLINPLWSGVRARPGANLLLIVADDSQSLQIRDDPQGPSRGETLRKALADTKAPWQVRLGQDFDVRRYAVSTRLENMAEFAALTFDGPQSSLAGALDLIGRRFEDRPVAGILLLTDGIATDRAGELDVSELPPVYPVPIGEIETRRDITVQNVSVSSTSFEDAPITVLADVNATGYDGERLTAQLLDSNGDVLATETQTCAADKPLAFRFQFRPQEIGISFYRVRVAAAEAIDRLDDPDAANSNESDEITLANNSRLVTVDRGQGPYRILYVSGRPNWEFKFLRRSLDEDEQLDLVGLIRIAKREPKFDFRSRVGENSNPLFRGFDKQDEETESYDQPVIVRLNTKSPEELRGGFPKTEDELFPFLAVILDDVDAEYFTHDQMELLERFVSERGGGVLMLGGGESFRTGDYARTPIGRMLPVYLDRVADAAPPGSYRLRLTRDGWLQPWARLEKTEADEYKRLDAMPGFHVLNRSERIKPGAMVIAEVEGPQGTAYPALAVQRFGRGRCAALTIGDLWRWQLERTDEQRSRDELGKAWRQMVRWLIADVPDKIELTAVPNEEAGNAVIELEARVRNEKFQPQDNAAVTVTLTAPDGEEVRLDAEPSLEEPGLYETVTVSRAAGGYRAKVAVTDAEGEKLGEAATGWSANPEADEFRSVATDREWLARLAEQTGGEVLALDGLEEFAESLPSRQVPITEQWTYPLWHQAWVFLLAIGCLIAEWGLRRTRGLP